MYVCNKMFKEEKKTVSTKNSTLNLTKLEKEEKKPIRENSFSKSVRFEE